MTPIGVSVNESFTFGHGVTSFHKLTMGKQHMLFMVIEMKINFLNEISK